MNIRRLQGWALVVAGLTNLIGLLGFIAGSDGSFFRVVNLIGGLLFIFGVPAVVTVRPMGTAGPAGAVLLEIGAIIALVLNFLVLTGATGFADALPLTSAAAGMIGAAIVGWMTAREKVFPAWVGWAFILQGVLNFVGPFLDLGALASALAIGGTLLEAAALFGYGIVIARYPD